MALGHKVRLMALGHRKVKQMANERKQIPIGLRVAPDLAEWLKKQAEENQRSVSNQAAWALQQYRKQQEDPHATS